MRAVSIVAGFGLLLTLTLLLWVARQTKAARSSTGVELFSQEGCSGPTYIALAGALRVNDGTSSIWRNTERSERRLVHT